MKNVPLPPGMTKKDMKYNIPIRANINKPMYQNIRAISKRLGGTVSDSDILRIALNYFFENCYDETDDVFLLFNINKPLQDGKQKQSGKNWQFQF